MLCLCSTSPTQALTNTLPSLTDQPRAAEMLQGGRANDTHKQKVVSLFETVPTCGSSGTCSESMLCHCINAGGCFVSATSTTVTCNHRRNRDGTYSHRGAYVCLSWAIPALSWHTRHDHSRPAAHLAIESDRSAYGCGVALDWLSHAGDQDDTLVASVQAS